MKQRFLYGEWLKQPNSSKKSPIIIYIHGFSDSSHHIRHFLIPIVHAGFEVVCYDNRGNAKSRKAGFKNQFKEIVFDLKDVILYVKNKNKEGRPIYLIGASLGSIAAIYQGIRFYKQGVEKVITLATIGDFQYALPHSPILFKKKWWVWIRYKFFRVPINPLPEENEILSPLFQIQKTLKEGQNSQELQDHLQKNFYLLHSKNDPIIPISHFFALIKELNLKHTNWLISKTGGHNFINIEPVIITQLIKYLNE